MNIITTEISRETISLNRFHSAEIYNDGQQAAYGDGRSGEEKFSAECRGHEKVGDVVRFLGQNTGQIKVGQVTAVETPVTGSTLLTIAVA